MKTLLFDLDGTLLEMDGGSFEKTYFTSLMNFYAQTEDIKSLSVAFGLAAKEMIENEDFSKTNEEKFYESFSAKVSPETRENVVSTIDDYYSHNFDVVKGITKHSQELVDTLKALRQVGYQVILATNPMLPKVATDKRINWAGFTPEDFDHVTRFEEYHACKPAVAYYQEIVERLDLDPQNCVMIGNDIQEDGAAKALGMAVWIVDTNIIDRNTGSSHDWIGSKNELLVKLKTLISEKDV